MKCPMCCRAMRPLKIGDIRIDECLRCGGIWFGKGELAEVKNEVDPDLRSLGVEIWRREARFNINGDRLNCPRCRNVSMRTVNFQEPDIDFTFCAFCEGIWLDAGGFKKIFDALSEEAASKSVAEYVKTGLLKGRLRDLQPPQKIYIGMEGSESGAAYDATPCFV